MAALIVSIDEWCPSKNGVATRIMAAKLTQINSKRVPVLALNSCPVCPNEARVITASVITPIAPVPIAWIDASLGNIAGAKIFRPMRMSAITAHA